SYMKSVQAVTESQVRDFAKSNLPGGDLVIVGDSKIFMDDLKKRFPSTEIKVVSADKLNLDSESLR
ncbi:MAG: hypothetical protein JWN60_564, partial [Acidobacteria bacterium]|nr:hypothetical protein [Acidobacteriota bacterium]